jgi:hypothetical protein
MSEPQWKQHTTGLGDPLGLNYLITPLQLLRDAAHASRVPAQILDAIAAVQAALDQAQTILTSRRTVGLAVGALIRALIAPYFTDGAYVITHSNLAQLIERIGVDAMLRNRLRPAALREDPQYPGLQTSYAYTRPNTGNIAQGKLLQLRNSALDLANDVSINEFTDWLDGMMSAFYDESDVNRPVLYDSATPILPAGTIPLPPGTEIPTLPNLSKFGGIIFTVEGTDPVAMMDRISSLLRMFRLPDNLRIRLFELDMPIDIEQTTYNGPLQQVRLWNPAERRREVITTVSPDFNRISTADLLQLLDPVLNSLMFSADIVGPPWPLIINLDGIAGGLAAAWMLLLERLETVIRTLQTFRDLLATAGISYLFLPPEAVSLDDFVQKVYSSAKTRDDFVRVLANDDRVIAEGSTLRLRGDVVKKSEALELRELSSLFNYGPVGDLFVAGIGIFFQSGPLAELLGLLFNSDSPSADGNVESPEYREAVNVTLNRTPSGASRAGIAVPRRPRQATISTSQIRSSFADLSNVSGPSTQFVPSQMGSTRYSGDLPDLANVLRRTNTGSETSDRVWGSVPSGYSPSGQWDSDTNVKLVNGYLTVNNSSSWSADTCIPVSTPVGVDNQRANQIDELQTTAIPACNRIVSEGTSGGVSVPEFSLDAAGALFTKAGLRQTLLVNGIDPDTTTVWADFVIEWGSGAVTRVRTKVFRWLNNNSVFLKPALPSSPLAATINPPVFHVDELDYEQLTVGQSPAGCSAEVHCRLDASCYYVTPTDIEQTDGFVADDTHVSLQVKALDHIVSAASSRLSAQQTSRWSGGENPVQVGDYVIGSSNVWPGLEYENNGSENFDRLVGHEIPTVVNVDDTLPSRGWAHVHVAAGESKIGVGSVSTSPFYVYATVSQISLASVKYLDDDNVWQSLPAPFTVTNSSTARLLSWTPAARAVALNKPAIMVFSNPSTSVECHYAVRNAGQIEQVCSYQCRSVFLKSVSGGAITAAKGIASPGFSIDGSGVRRSDATHAALSAPGLFRVSRVAEALRHRQLEVKTIAAVESVFLPSNVEVTLCEGLNWRIVLSSDLVGVIRYAVDTRAVSSGSGLGPWSRVGELLTGFWDKGATRSVKISACPRLEKIKIQVEILDEDGEVVGSAWAQEWEYSGLLEGHPVDGGRVFVGNLDSSDPFKTPAVPVIESTAWYSVYPLTLLSSLTSVKDPDSV